jgi:hypothetical protein
MSCEHLHCLNSMSCFVLVLLLVVCTLPHSFFSSLTGP